MLFKRILQLLLSSTPAIGSVLAGSDPQQPLGAGLAPPPPPDQKAPSYRADLVALHKRLVEIPSTSGLEHDAGDFLVDYFISKSWNYETQPVPPRPDTPADKPRFNVVAWPPSSPTSAANRSPDPKVLVTSHIDCVPPHIPYSISEGDVTRDTTISGRCSVDAKGSVAAQLTAVDSLLASGALRPEDVMVLYVVGEEINGDGMKTFSARNASALAGLRAAVFGEPTENKLACGHKGALRCDVVARGRAAHSGYPWLGKSANEVLMRALIRVLDADLGSSERYGNTTVNVGMMEGGVALNVVPAHAHATLLSRVAVEPQKTGHEIVVERIAQILKEVDDDALSLDCPVGQGVTRCDCDVDGKPHLGSAWAGTGLLILLLLQALIPWSQTTGQTSHTSRATMPDICTGPGLSSWPMETTRL